MQKIIKLADLEPVKTERLSALVLACRSLTAKSLETMHDIMLNSKYDRERASAAKYLLARGWGDVMTSKDMDALDAKEAVIVETEEVYEVLSPKDEYLKLIGEK